MTREKLFVQGGFHGAGARIRGVGTGSSSFVGRREFLGFLGSSAALAALPAFARKPEEIRAMLFHWGLNMWGESLPDDVQKLNGIDQLAAAVRS